MQSKIVSAHEGKKWGLFISEAKTRYYVRDCFLTDQINLNSSLTILFLSEGFHYQNFTKYENIKVEKKGL